MSRHFQAETIEGRNAAPSNKAWQFAQALLGKSPSSPSREQPETLVDREQMAWVAAISPDHKDHLRTTLREHVDATSQRAQLEWLAQVSTRHESQLRRLLATEAEASEARARYERLVESSILLEDQWESAKHPRLGGPPNAGWFATTGGSASGAQLRATGPQLGSVTPIAKFQTVGHKRLTGAANAKRQTGVPQQTSDAAGAKPPVTSQQDSTSAGAAKSAAGGRSNAPDPSHWYLPADDKGTWVGAKGDGTFRLKTPIDAGGKLVRQIQYTKGIPVLDGFVLPGNTATIVLTGDSNTDIRNAKAVWQKLNPGKPLPPNSTFHHDLLNVVEETVTIGGKKTKVLVGKMQLIPSKINQAIYHEGSASVADKFYRGLDIDVSSVKSLAKSEATAAADGSKIVAKATKRIIPGKIAKGVRPFVGRSIVRAIPIVGTGLAILEFSDNLEAHGIGGAVARAVPVLGDLISAHDLGSDLAKQITDDANSALDASYQATNTPVSEAWQKASEQTVEAFQDLAPQIQVTNVYGPNGRVDPVEVMDALKNYRQEMQEVNYLRAVEGEDFNFDAAAAQAKQKLTERLIDACQKDAPRRTGPVL